MARQETEEGQTIEKLNETNSVGAISDISDVRDWKQRGGKASRDVLNLKKNGRDEMCLLFPVYLAWLEVTSYQYSKLNIE